MSCSNFPEKLGCMYFLRGSQLLWKRFVPVTHLAAAQSRLLNIATGGEQIDASD